MGKPDPPLEHLAGAHGAEKRDSFSIQERICERSRGGSSFVEYIGERSEPRELKHLST